MTFNDEQKQKEFEAFAAWYAEVAKRPSTSAVKSLMNQLRDIGTRLYGNGAFQEVLRANKVATLQPEQAERKLGKPQGDAARRSLLPTTVKLPQPGTGRYERQKERGLLGGKSEAPAVVAAVDDKLSAGQPKTTKKDVAKAIIAAAELSGIIDPSDDEEAAGLARDEKESDLQQDVLSMKSTDLVEKYGRGVIYAKLTLMGEDAESLSEKTDRQLANILKKKMGA